MNKVFMFAFIFIMVMGLASGTDYLPHQQNTAFDLVVQSNNATQCNLTYIQRPNGINSLFNIPLSKSSQTFTYSLNSNNYTQLGNICHGIICTDGISQQSGSVCRNITPSGFNTGTFTFIFIIIIALIFTIGMITKNTWVMTLGSILVLIFGFFIIKFGVDIIKDTQTTWAIGLVVWALGFYFLYLSVEEQLKLWG